jgi:hypothetical protein
MVLREGCTATSRFPPMVLATILAIASVGTASAIDWGPEAYEEDVETCRVMGADNGRDFTWCMMEQQQRRDEALQNAVEQQLINAAAAALNLETVRRMRCEREAAQAIELGEQPQACP